MKAPYQDYLFGFYLFLLVGLPSAAYTVFHTSSFALSLSCSLLPIICLYGTMILTKPATNRFPIRLFFFLLPILVFIYLHAVISAFKYDDFDCGRFVQSTILLALVIQGALFISTIASKLTPLQIAGAARFLFFALLITGLLACAKFSPFADPVSKTVVFFGEPSHYALSFLPCLLFMVVSSKPRMKFFWIALCCFMAYKLENLTFFIGIGLIAFLAFPLKRFIQVMATAVIAVSASSLNLAYYADRVNVSDGPKNYSSLTFLQGWERAYINLIDTYGFGVGFAQFGIVGRRGNLTELIFQMLGRDLGLLDGGSTGAKFIGEFGLFAVFALLCYLYNFFKLAKWIRGVSQGSQDAADYTRVFFVSCFLMYGIDLFVRGTGYFAPSGLLFMISMDWMLSKKLPNFFTRRNFALCAPKSTYPLCSAPETVKNK